MARIRTTQASVRVRVCTEDDAESIEALCHEYRIRCTIEIDPDQPEDTSALDAVLNPSERPGLTVASQKGET